MSFRMRKTINLGGGFRINLSKSGIGYSWGVPGFRVTKSARRSTGRNLASTSRPAASQPKEEGMEYAAVRDIESAGIESFKTAETDNITSAIERTILLDRCGTIGVHT